MAANSSVMQSSHPLILHKITQMRKVHARVNPSGKPPASQAHAATERCTPPSWQAKCGPKYLTSLLREVSTFLCYEATAQVCKLCWHARSFAFLQS